MKKMLYYAEIYMHSLIPVSSDDRGGVLSPPALCLPQTLQQTHIGI